MQTCVGNAYIVKQYQGKRESRLQRCRHEYETHALLRLTKENTEIVYIDADTRVKRMHFDAIPRKRQK